MPRRKHVFATDEIYHCYNRGTDKRVIFNEVNDYAYFLKSMKAYNSLEAVGNLRLQPISMEEEQIVTLLSYCLLPNHFHMVLQEKTPGGISKFMQRLSIGYTMYFNKKNDRSGVLFQGPFKSKLIESDQDLRQVLAYVQFNFLVHGIENKKLYRTGVNTEHPLVRDPYSESSKEIVEIIKSLRTAYE